MLIPRRHQLKSVLFQKIEVHKIHKVYGLFLENEASDPELYVLEDLSSEKCEKTIIICQEMFDLDYELDELEFIGGFTINKNTHKFWVFEVLSDKVQSTPEQEVKIERPEPINIPEGIPSIAKWARIPKPDLDKIYTKEELKSMHPERQLKYILSDKYELKGRVRNKLSTDKKIEYILRKQNGEDLDPISLIDESPIFIPKKNIESILNITLDETPTTPMVKEVPTPIEINGTEITITQPEQRIEQIPIKNKPIESTLIFKVSDDPQI